MLAVLLPLALVNTLFNTACSSNTPPPSASGVPVRYIVTAEETPFYKYGPAQANGPDLKLRKGRILIMLDRHYGYSRVETDDNEAGYVGTDDIAPAPQESALVPGPIKKPGDGQSRSRSGARTPDFDQPNDVPLPSGQPPSDQPAPSFRY
jgi:hypothetical protein